MQARLVALQHHDFRLFWFGRLLSTTGSQMQNIAVNWQIFELLQGQSFTVSLLNRTIELNASALGLGSLGLVRIIPIIIFAMLGGLLADTVNRRKLLIYTQLAAAIFSGLLAILTLTDNITIFFIYILSAAGAATSAFDEPARQSLVPNLVPAKHLTNAISLNTLMWYGATIAGPAIAGVLVSLFDVGVVYAIDSMSFTAVIVALLFMKYRGHVQAKTGGVSWAALKEGISFTYHNKLVWSTMILDFIATFFASARSMLPIVATEVLGLGVRGYGILATAQPIGAVIAGVILALRKDIKKQGVVLLISVTIYGIATALFGLSTIFFISYVLFAFTGAGDTVSTVIRGTLRQITTPDHLRGRMTSVNMLFFMGGPQLGELEAGLIASAFGAPFAIVSGGILTVIFVGVIAWRYPILRRYEGQTEEVENTAVAL